MAARVVGITEMLAVLLQLVSVLGQRVLLYASATAQSLG